MNLKRIFTIGIVGLMIVSGFSSIFINDKQMMNNVEASPIEMEVASVDTDKFRLV